MLCRTLDIGYAGFHALDPDMERIARMCCIWRKLAESPEDLAVRGLEFLRRAYREARL